MPSDQALEALAATVDVCRTHVAGASDASQPPAPETPEIPAALGELLSLLAQELGPLADLIEEAMALVHGDAAARTGWPEACEHLAEQFDCFAAAAEAAALDGLQETSAALAAAWRDAAAGADEGLVATVDALHAAHLALVAYMAAPFTTVAARDLVDAMRAPGWPLPLTETAAHALGERLLDLASVTDMTEEVPERPTLASSELTSLALPDDAPPELLETLLEELPILTEQFSSAIERIQRGGQHEDVNVAQRVAHTLKGAANTVGVAGIANLTHHVEDLLRAHYEAGAMPGPALVADMVRVSDCLDGMSEAIAGIGPAPDDTVAVLQLVLDRANRVDAEGLEAALEESPTSVSDPSAEAPREAAPEVESIPVPAPETAAGAAASVRVPARLVDDFMRLTGETIILTGQVHERMQGALRQAGAMHDQFAILQQLGYELEQLIDVGDISLPGFRAGNDSNFDPLEFDEYSELHTLSRRMVEAATDAREMGRLVERQLHELLSMLRDQAQLNRESHDRVLETRMVPVKAMVPRWQRAVRQAARATGKEVALEVLGAETQIDSDVLGEIVDPLMHVLRNAVDHGIEPAAEREARGKAPGGRIELEFLRAGSQVLVRCRDDGAGLDLEAIRAAALIRGRFSAGQEPSEEQLRRLILEPNFSTRERATQVSGRGIGLDAVYSKVVALGGSFDLQSSDGRGCAVELSVPLTLISAHALLVRVRRHVLALSSRGVEQILHTDSGTLREIGQELTYQIGETIYPATYLDALLTMPADDREEERGPRTAVLCQSEEGPVAIMVQEVIDSRDLVVKSLGRYLPKVRGVAGATILGDGGVTPVLDLPELLRAPARVDLTTGAGDGHREARQANLPTALVVDDSLSARRSLARVMGDFGYQVRTARDGLEAVEILKGLAPDVLLVDLEMPRMNGLELVAHLRNDDVHARVPVVMITSRSTAKHRDMAHTAGVDVYLTKPFSEDDLLGHVETLRGIA